MRLILSVIRGALLLLAALSAEAATGSPRMATDFDLQSFIDNAIKAGAKRVVVPAGRYRVRPQGGRHLFFKDLADVEILAEGVEMVCTQTVQAVRFEDCRRVSLKGLTVDYDPLPFTQARITSLAPDKSWVEFEVIDGYPENSLEERIEIYDPATRELRRETADGPKSFSRSVSIATASRRRRATASAKRPTPSRQATFW